jgi:cytidylate kinase
VVLPGADLKIFLTAPPGVRAGRRQAELGPDVTAARVSKEINARDRRDTTRTDSPLKKAEDALDIDTSSLDAKGVVARILGYIEERLPIEDIHS